MQKEKQDLVLKKDLQEGCNIKNMIVRNQYNLLANLFRYPQGNYVQQVNECARYLSEFYPSAYKELLPFVNWVNNQNEFEIEEVFGKTFHIQAICYLDLGYVLFAEDYKRGEFLVQMKNEQRKAKNDCGCELADNLPNVLTLMAILQDEDFLDEFAERVMKPALGKMLKEFDDARIALKDKVRKKKQKVIIMEDLVEKNIFQYTLLALKKVVDLDFQEEKYNDPVIVPTLGIDALNCNSGCSPTQQPLKMN